MRGAALIALIALLVSFPAPPYFAECNMRLGMQAWRTCVPYTSSMGSMESMAPRTPSQQTTGSTSTPGSLRQDRILEYMHSTTFRQYGQASYYDSGFQRVCLKHNLRFKGWNSQVHREFPGKFESAHLSRENLSREIGRMVDSDIARSDAMKSDKEGEGEEECSVARIQQKGRG